MAPRGHNNNGCHPGGRGERGRAVGGAPRAGTARLVGPRPRAPPRPSARTAKPPPDRSQRGGGVSTPGPCARAPRWGLGGQAGCQGVGPPDLAVDSRLPPALETSLSTTSYSRDLTLDYLRL